MDPIVAMAALAEASDRTRILSLVLANDLRHPAVVHKAAATIDRASNGRLELGLGTGWMPTDYQATGIPFDPIGVRIDRLEESVAILTGLFAGGRFSFSGDHYSITDLEGVPEPVQRPHPPIMLAGGGKRMLGLAARVAGIVGIHARLSEPSMGADAAADLAEDRVMEKIGWVRAAATEAGRSPEDLELQFTVYHCQVADSHRAGQASLSAFAATLGADPVLAARSPAVLVGSVATCVEALQERRERFGLSYLKLAGRPEEVAPIVARLAGT
jgi:probable F420-dependent oxidoreductase